MSIIWNAGDRGTAALLILKGVVRTFKCIKGTLATSGKARLVYQEEKISTELIGDQALGGLKNRIFTAQAISDCEFLIIEEDDFIDAFGSLSSTKLSVQERYSFLRAISNYAKWDSYKLYNMAQTLK